MTDPDASPEAAADAAAQAAAPSAAPDPSPSPLFYGRVEVLDARRHAGLRLAPHDGYAFAAAAIAVPLNLSEFARAAVWYPIVFTGRETLSPVAVTGLRRGGNLFVDAGGRWDPDAYVPAYARRYPFILSHARAGEDQVALCADLDSPRLSETEGEPLFADGAPAAPARAALEFCLAFQRQAGATMQAVQALRDHDLLSRQEGKVTLKSGETLRLTDFHVVDEKKLDAVPDEALPELRRSGALAAAYCQMVSMNCWPRLAALAEARGG